MIASLCNDAKLDEKDASLPLEQRTIHGNATDAAVLRFAESLSLPTIGIDNRKLTASYDKLFNIPFNSRNKWMLTVIREKEKPDVDSWVLVKGAPDVLLPMCANVLQADGTESPIDSTNKQRLEDLQENWSRQGQRVIALCKKPLPAAKADLFSLPPNEVEEMMYENLTDLTLVGFLGICDPPRPNAKDTVTILRRAGIRVFMVTGDFALTGVSIAKQVRTFCSSICSRSFRRSCCYEC